MNLMEKGFAWLNEMRERYDTVPIVYRRGVYIVDLQASIRKTRFRTTNSFGVSVVVESRDYIFNVADLVLDHVHTIPQKGDEIHEIRDTEKFVYSVTAPENEPVYKYSDAGREAFRVHSKYIKRIPN